MEENKKKLNMLEYDNIVKECREMAINKNNDYGCDTMLKFMEQGLVIRMYDKMERLVNITNLKHDIKIKDEKIEDTTKDLINYAIYLIMMQRKKLC
jgi:hypothetical protein